VNTLALLHSRYTRQVLCCSHFIQLKQTDIGEGDACRTSKRRTVESSKSAVQWDIPATWNHVQHS